MGFVRIFFLVNFGKGIPKCASKCIDTEQCCKKKGVGNKKQKERRRKWKEPVIDVATQLVTTPVCAECCITVYNLRNSEKPGGKRGKALEGWFILGTSSYIQHNIGDQYYM